MKTPTNTTRRSQESPLGFLLDAMAMGTSNAILNQEATGQRELVNSEVLPTEMHGKCRETLESIGFRFGELVKG